MGSDRELDARRRRTVMWVVGLATVGLDAGGDQCVRVEHRDAERPLVRAHQGHEHARRQRLCRGVHRDLVRIEPGMAGFRAAMTAGQQGDARSRRRVVDLGHDGCL